jgi:hypothetical protein
MTSLSSAENPAEPLQFSLERRVGKFEMRESTAQESKGKHHDQATHLSGAGPGTAACVAGWIVGR